MLPSRHHTVGTLKRYKGGGGGGEGGGGRRGSTLPVV